MSILFLDTETTGMANFKVSSTDPSQPHIVQIASQLVCPAGRTVGELNLLIKPEGWIIPPETTAIHGITQEYAEKYGIRLKGAMELLWRMLGMSKVVVAHNMSFDFFMLRIAAHRCGLSEPKDMPIERFCTMKAATDVVKLPPTEKMKAAGFNRYKPTNLQEAYEFFFKEQFIGAHDAMNDVKACRAIYYKLMENNIL